MLTYNNDQKLKTGMVKEIAWHRKMDMLAKGSYGSQNGSWHGCAVACSLRSFHKLKKNDLVEEYSNHSDFERLGLWPEWLARLEDTLFENLPEEESQLWPERLAKAVPVGVDITPVKWKFSAFLLKENIDRVLGLEIQDELKEQVVSAIRGVLSVHEQAIEAGEWNESAAESAARSAWSAAWSAWSAAWSAAYVRYSKELLRLLKEQS